MKSRPTVLLAEQIGSIGMRILEESADVVVAPSTAPTVLASELLRTRAEGLIVRSTLVPSEVLGASKSLQVVGRHGAGLENIDLAAAERFDVQLVNTPGANATSVAEFVLLSTLVLTRNLEGARRAFLKGQLSTEGSLPGAVQRHNLSGRTLRGRTLGIVGFGAIGREVASMATGFGMNVTFHDPYVASSHEEVEHLELDELLTRSDIVSLHLPLTPSTRGLLNERRLALLPANAILVNTARASVVVAQDIIAALNSGAVGGYAVDVFDPEPPPTDDPLITHPNVLATPHMAAITDDALDSMATTVAQGVLAAITSTTEDVTP